MGRNLHQRAQWWLTIKGCSHDPPLFHGLLLTAHPPAQVHAEDARHHGSQRRRKRGDGQQQLQAVDLRGG